MPKRVSAMFDDRKHKVAIHIDEEALRDLRRSRRQRNDNPWTRLVWGCSILAAGIIGWLDHTGQLNASDYFRWWPLILIALGLAHLPRKEWGKTGGLLAVGMTFLPAPPVRSA